MKLSVIIQILDAEIVCIVKSKLNSNVTMACGSDLMSDVLAFIKRDALLLTGLTTIQVVYTAENAGVNVVCFVRGKKPPKETVDLAKEKKITLLTTKMSMFESCGKLYNNGLIGCSDDEN
ncbi:MAG: DRTGG domain-containing protein [Bacteroidota bacterium]